MESALEIVIVVSRPGSGVGGIAGEDAAVREGSFFFPRRFRYDML